MKSLVVLFALVPFAIAAPAQPGASFGVTNRSPNWHIQGQSSLTDFLKRERKSPSEIATSSSFNPALNSETQNVQFMDTGVSTPMARSFALKKPLIVKKKNGYRLYRDSEEEKANADSQESCGRQVKVKLCDEDGKFRNPTKGSAHERADLHTTEDDVKRSIKMAKEAVENLQRDLKKMEQKPDMITAHDSESDTELHEDIEVARQALEHIHDNFGNLETMSLHATASRDSEPVQDVHLAIAKTEEARLAQWKEAIENIQKNFEIVKNIEDSFKAADNQETLVDLDQSEPAKKNEHNIEDHVRSHEPLTQVNQLQVEENTELESHKAPNDHLGEHNAREEPNTEDDMKSAASEMIETHLDNNKNRMPLISESQTIHENEKSSTLEGKARTEDNDLGDKDNNVKNQEKSSETNMDMLTDHSEPQPSQVPMKIDEETQQKLDFGENVAFKNSENIPDASKDSHRDVHVTPFNDVEPLDLDTIQEQQRTVDPKEEKDKIENDENQVKNVADDMIDFLAKSAEHSHPQEMEKEHIPQEHPVELGKTAETPKSENVEHLSEDWDMQAKEAAHNPLTETKNEEDVQHIPKAAEHLELINLPNVPEQTELAKSADHISILDHQKQHMAEQEEPNNAENVMTIKAAEENFPHLEQMHNVKWNPNSFLDHLSSMKAAEGFKNDFEIPLEHEHIMEPENLMDHMRNSHLVEQSHLTGNTGVPNDFELSSNIQPHHHFSQRYHHNQMPQSKLHDMNTLGSHMHANYHPSMRDVTEGFGPEPMFRWKPTHDSARAAYGSSLPSSIGSTGAVGVFPNANTGGCGIPLLLSCSPSVVSGSLAKAHPAVPSSYGAAPASSYRTEDDFSFQHKRDIKKTNEIRTTEVLRSPTITKQRNVKSS